MTEPSSVLIGSRFIFDTAALFLWGAGLFLWLLAPRKLGFDVWRRLAPVRAAAIVAVTASVLAILPTRAAGLGNGWSSALDANLVWLMLWNTSMGTAWLVQAGATLVLVALAVARRDGPAASAVLAAILLASTVLTGHAAMSDGWVRSMHQANSVLHLLSGGAWVGALVPVLLILPMLAQKQAELAGRALIRFSTMGHVAVVLVTLSGAANALLIVGSIPLDLASAYQVLLWAKIVAVAAMVGLAVVNRYVFVPQFRQKSGAVRALALGTAAELVLVVFVIGLVAWFGTLQPTA